jgi:hypothetical protein
MDYLLFIKLMIKEILCLIIPDDIHIGFLLTKLSLNLLISLQYRFFDGQDNNFP